VAQQGASVAACSFLVELTFLAGREKLGAVPVFSLITY
jgi:adenine/guanine phosphoribosyltransferase-like PRPP-binding protein